jgi:hypothetical protein
VIDCSRKRNAVFAKRTLIFVDTGSISSAKAAGPIRPPMTAVEIGYD